MYDVCRTTIRNVVDPDVYQRQLDRYKTEKMSSKYYNKDKQKLYSK
jgi:hypothetical protein